MGWVSSLFGRCDFGPVLDAIEALRKDIMKLSELAAELAASNAQITKGLAEVVARIAALEAALGDADIPQAAQDELAALKAAAQRLDDVVPDAPVPT